MSLIGYILMLLVGLTMGLLGGGGSILTVPILTSLFGLSPIIATADSLFIVGFTAAFGTFAKFKQGDVDFKTALTFAIPGFLGVFFSRAVVIPFLPSELIKISNFVLTKEIFIMLVFSIIMLLASFSMIRGRREVEVSQRRDSSYLIKLILLGFMVGLLSGFVGAGGGFLIIPALVSFAQLKIKKAIGTSLVIIAINSIFGFFGEVFIGSEIQWGFLLVLTLISILGIYIGSLFSKKVSDKKLKKMFGYFVLVMGLFIFTKQFVS